MEYYTAIKKNKLQTHAATWTNLRDIMRSVRSQIFKKSHLYEVQEHLKLMEVRIVVISDLEGVQGKLLGLKMISKVFCMVVIRKDSLLRTVSKRRDTPLHTSRGHTGKH